MSLIQLAKQVFDIESESVLNLKSLIDKDFEKSVDLILNSNGKLIITGMGKSGIIGRKIAATLASTGTPSFFVHPAEAYHGDLGMIENNDIVLLIAYSGETDEVLKLIPFLQRNNIQSISITGNPNSTLAKNTNYHLNVFVEKEACPLQLAPTSSTTATLAMGDALAIVLMRLRNFKDENFAQFHPGGSLGRRLLTHVEDIMKTEYLPVCSSDGTMKDIISEISKGKSGLVVVIKDSKVVGIITDGDIRRCMELHSERFLKLKATDIMTFHPKTVTKDTKLIEAQKLMNEFKVSSLLVVDDKEKLLGIIQLFDID